MIFKLHYESKKKKITNSLRLFLINFLFDIIKVSLINIPVLFIVFLALSSIRELLPEILLQNYSAISYTVVICIFIIELIIICITELKQSGLYVFIRSDGIIIHSRNYECFGIIQKPSKSTFIPYNRILSCYIAVPLNIEKDVSFMYKNMFDDIINFFHNTVGARHLMNLPLILPSIKGGRYNCECVMLELDNNRTIVLPIDECGKFLEIFQKYSGYL